MTKHCIQHASCISMYMHSISVYKQGQMAADGSNTAVHARILAFNLPICFITCVTCQNAVCFGGCPAVHMPSFGPSFGVSTWRHRCILHDSECQKLYITAAELVLWSLLERPMRWLFRSCHALSKHSISQKATFSM